MQPAHFENGMVSTTEWQADASLWKEDTFFDAGTFCLPSVFPETSLEAYKVEYDLETGIHYVSLILKGILGLSTQSISSQSSHVAEFSRGMIKAVPRRGKGGVSRHENPSDVTNSPRHTSPNIKAAIDLQKVDPAILHVRSSTHRESDGYTGSEATTEIIENHIAITDSIRAVYSPKKRPEEAASLHILTDLVLKDDMSPSPSSASASPPGNSPDTPSKPSTNATSPTFSLPLDLVEDNVPEEVSKTISALDLDEKASVFLEPWHCISLQWLDLAISHVQNYINYTVEERERTEEPKCAPEDEGANMFPRPSSPEEAEESVRLEELDIGEPEYAEVDQTVEVSPRLSSPEEVEGPLQLEYLDLDATLGQGATDLDGESLPEEAIAADDEAVVEDDTAAVGSPNDYSPNSPEVHHLNLLRNPVFQASRTPSALSLWVTMICTKRAHIEDPVCLKAVLSSQAARWVDPVLLEEDVSVPEEVTQDGSASAYRNSFIGLTAIQYEPYGIWQSDDYDDEQEIPQVVKADNRELLAAAYEESYGFPGLQRPYLVNDKDVHHGRWSFPCHSIKQQRGWETLERRGNSNLRSVLDEDSITRWNTPAATSTPYEAAEPTDLQEEEDHYTEDSLVFPAEDSEHEDRLSDCEAEERFRDASSLRSLLASSSLTRGVLSSPKEGRFFTPGIREEYGDLDDSSESLDGDAWETDDNGAFVSPKKGKERLGGEMVDLRPMGLFRNPTPVPGTMMPREGATEGENALPVALNEPITQEDVLRAALSQPYHKYNDLSEIPRHPDFAATVGQATRRAARWLIENLLW